VPFTHEGIIFYGDAAKRDDMKIYFDTCCYGRPYDDRTKPTIDAEAEAVMVAVDLCHIVGYGIVGSDAITFEIGRIPDTEARIKTTAFYNNTKTEIATMTDDAANRAEVYQKSVGMGVMDSYHLVSAETAGASVLLTTDKNFIKKAAKVNSAVTVMNPLHFKL
jgi:predicted nucleic acid-binding protein